MFLPGLLHRGLNIAQGLNNLSQPTQSPRQSPWAAAVAGAVKSGTPSDGTLAAYNLQSAQATGSVQYESKVGLNVYDFMLDEGVAEDEYDDELMEGYEYQNQGGTHHGQSRA